MVHHHHQIGPGYGGGSWLEATVPELTPGSVVTLLRSLSRTTVLVVCTALLVLVITVLRLLDAPTWTQIVGAVFVFALALASEADKRVPRGWRRRAKS
jgi:ABC-type nickel/cobalt efflux system permease component RcnA